MATSKAAHAHIDRPTETQLKGTVKHMSADIRQLYLDTHRLVLETVPDLAYSVDCTDAMIGYGARQFGYNAWGMAALAPHTKWISLGFVKGAALDDPDGLLEGTGKSVRHVKIKSLDDLSTRRAALRRFLKAAVKAGGA